jgi:hypothetical protein
MNAPLAINAVAQRAGGLPCTWRRFTSFRTRIATPPFAYKRGEIRHLQQPAWLISVAFNLGLLADRDVPHTVEGLFAPTRF